MWFLRPSNRTDIRPILCEQVHPAWKAAHQDYIDELAEAFQLSPFYVHPSQQSLLGGLTEFLVHAAKSQIDLIAHLKHFHAAFLQRYARTTSDYEQHRAILDYARILGASERQIQGDKRAFDRFLDRQTMDDRNRRRVGEGERKLVFILDQLGIIAAKYIKESQFAPEKAWERLNLERVCLPLVDHSGDTRVRTAALRSLLPPIQALPSHFRSTLLSDEAVRRVYQIAQQPELDVWLQEQALQLIRQVDLSAYETLLTARLKEDHGGDDLFFRRRAVDSLAKDIQTVPTLTRLAETVANDPSPFVRQGLMDVLLAMPMASVEALLPPVFYEEKEPSVRAHAWLGVSALAQREDFFAFLIELLPKALHAESNDYVTRVAMHVASDVHRTLQSSHAQQWYEALIPAIVDIHTERKSLPVRRWAAQARERLWCQEDGTARELAAALTESLAGLKPGKCRTLASKALPSSALDQLLLGRVLSVLSQEDFGWDVATRGRRRLQFSRGHRFGFKWWRFLHESWHPSPDKRQGFRHTIGREFAGELRVPSCILAEISPTKVPGEPLMISDEAGWRPYLPILDEVLCALKLLSPRRPLRIVTSEGVTTLVPPRSWIKRTLARIHITRNFAEIAALRNWKASAGSAPKAYIKTLRQLGMDLTFEAHRYPVDHQPDREVTKFFDLASGAMLWGSLAMIDPENWDRLKEYFYSVHGNSILELAVFMMLAVVVFFGRHFYVNRCFQQARRCIPQVLGGWGSRGKSGTERIKAALINALGYPLVSKTTGCEAMFLHADSFGETEELFLFRPYDKATIWEQLNIVGLASEMKSKVFLWECMGLTPSYVAILQRQWMRDDLSTIVNTYPDHEDLQGPAGIDIPEVMTNFLTDQGKVLTSEQQMTPILKEAADSIGTELHEVNWIAPGLLTPDLIKRFPYDEHPNNIALVMVMGEHLGVPSDFSVKEMADRVVPDLGVLKTYPIAKVDGRRLQFINGMSANERFGCLANWGRLKFDTHDPYQDPGEWLSTVVNNRADRIARSKVFASILVHDISADRHFLIGSNLKGLLGYVREAWDVFASKLTLESNDDQVSSLEILENAVRALRQPISAEDIKARLRSMLEGLNPDHSAVDAIVDHWESATEMGAELVQDEIWAQCQGDILRTLDQDKGDYEAYVAFKERVAANSGNSLDEEFRSLLWKWFERKLYVVDDYHASGDTVIQHIALETPPGFRNRIMGLQNIKGTGLDFVYRWQAWDKCHASCVRLLDDDIAVAAEGLHQLAALDDHGLLGNAHVRDALDQARDRDVITGDEGGTNRKELQAIRARLDKRAQESQIDAAADEPKQNRWIHQLQEKLRKMLESFLDAGDAVRRRKYANQVYRDLANERISIARAAKEIQLLNKRQKGGWFRKQEGKP